MGQGVSAKKAGQQGAFHNFDTLNIKTLATRLTPPGKGSFRGFIVLDCERFIETTMHHM